MDLTEHFTLSEFIASSKATQLNIDNTPPDWAISNLTRTAELLEKVRALFGRPLGISSGFRCLELNRSIGSKDTSQHVLGCAADFHIDGYTPHDIIERIAKSDIEYDQIIEENLGGKSWVHISVPNHPSDGYRKQKLIIDSHGTRSWNG